MSTLLVCCVVLLIAVVILCAEVWSLPRRRHRVLVNLQAEEGAIAGVLWSRRGCWLVVKDARLFPVHGEPVPVDGEVLIDKARVTFVQVL